MRRRDQAGAQRVGEPGLRCCWGRRGGAHRDVPRLVVLAAPLRLVLVEDEVDGDGAPTCYRGVAGARVLAVQPHAAPDALHRAHVDAEQPALGAADRGEVAAAGAPSRVHLRYVLVGHFVDTRHDLVDAWVCLGVSHYHGAQALTSHMSTAMNVMASRRGAARLCGA